MVYDLSINIKMNIILKTLIFHVFLTKIRPCCVFVMTMLREYTLISTNLVKDTTLLPRKSFCTSTSKGTKFGSLEQSATSWYTHVPWKSNLPLSKVT